MTPYTAVIFTNRRTDHDETGYTAMADEMERLAGEQPGYLGIESVRATDGAGITVSYWVDHESAAAWKLEAEHLAAQRLGRERWYDAYRVRIATVEREYAFVRPIFHLALPTDWAPAEQSGTYPLSTRGLTFEQQGFVHCSFVDQMEGVANRFYADLDELVVLHLDRASIADTLRIEPASDLVDEQFPHLYAPITTNAVTATTMWRRDGEVWVDPPVTTDRPLG
ncbi:MAG: DUF952 domain-containing protein [Ilumatobacter fluminis]|uniref:DUF952 domain-containing protein n=1 Tax=Ilumatobacter fluminis TaxID=467091 RepID=UPI0032EF7640